MIKKILSWIVGIIIVFLLLCLAIIGFGGHVGIVQASCTKVVPQATQVWLDSKTSEQKEWILCNVPVDNMGPFTNENAYQDVDEIAPLTFSSKGEQCRKAHIEDRIRSWPSHSTIAKAWGNMKFCHKNGVVTTHHWNTSYSCCSTYWSKDGAEQRKTGYKRWKGRPHGAFMGAYQVRFHFCPPILGCIDSSVLPMRIIVYGDGHSHKNTNIASF